MNKARHFQRGPIAIVVDTITAIAIVSAVITMLCLALSGCATAGTPKSRAKAAAVIQKTAVDGIGNAYLGYCKVVRKPACISTDEKASAAGTPQAKADRIACLRPCDSATAEKIQTAVDVLRTAQTLLFEMLKGEPTPQELAEQRDQLRRAADQLMDLLEETGAMRLLHEAVEGD